MSEILYGAADGAAPEGDESQMRRFLPNTPAAEADGFPQPGPDVAQLGRSEPGPAADDAPRAVVTYPVDSPGPDSAAGPDLEPLSGPMSGGGPEADRIADGGGPHTVPVVTGNHVGGNMNVAARDLAVYNYMQGLAHLRPRPVPRGAVAATRLFVPPPGYGSARAQLAADTSGQRPHHVLALTAEPGTGARTTALHLLSEVLDPSEEIFELLPDWEEADTARLPEAKRTGYLLNLAGTSEALPAAFHEHLAGYAEQARAAGTLLVILAPRSIWTAHARSGDTHLVAHTALGHPDPQRICERILAGDPAIAPRTAWLTTPGIAFGRLLTDSTAPGEAVRLAQVMAKAAGADDSVAMDEYLGWEQRLAEWFDGPDENAPPARALRIAGAFLDRCPAQVVLDATDELLARKELRWPAAAGGPLAGPSAKSRCIGAGMAFNSDGTVSLTQDRPGIDHALIKHLWHTRPQLVKPLTAWLSQISADGAVASAYREQIATALTAVAEAEGPTAVMNLLEQWLKAGSRLDLAVNLLDDLAVHPLVGPGVRIKLRGWASVAKYPLRQKAVALCCARQLGRTYPRTALTRLGYILDAPNTALQAREAAYSSLAKLLETPELAAATLTALVAWIPADSDALVTGSAQAFTEVFTMPDPGRDAKPSAGLDPRASVATRIQTLLDYPDPVGEAVRALIADAWRRAWHHPDTREGAVAALDSWCEAVEDGLLSQGALDQAAATVLTEEVNALADELHRIIGGHSEVRTRLSRQWAQAAYARLYPPTDPAATA